MTEPLYRRVYRVRNDPDGRRWAYSRGVPDILIGTDISVPGVKTDVITKYRIRAQGSTSAPGREGVLFNTDNAYGWYTGTKAWSDYGGPVTGVALTRYPASGEGDYTVPSSAANSIPTVLQGTPTGSTGTGTPIENMEFFGVVRLGSLQNVWFKNCIFNGTIVTGVATGAIEGTSQSLRGAVVQDSKINIRNNNTWHCGVRGSNWTGYRTEVTGAADGINWNAVGGNVKLFGMWIHNGAYDEWSAGDSSYPAQGSNYLHCDGVQGAQGANYYAKGCLVGGLKTGAWNDHAGNKANILAGDDFFNAAFLLAQAPAAPDGVQYKLTGTVEQCVIMGGTATVNVATSNGYDLAGFEFKDNIFPRWTGGQWYILKPANCNCKFTNNKHPDGAAVTIVAG